MIHNPLKQFVVFHPAGRNGETGINSISGNLLKGTVKTPKMQFFDTGLFAGG